VWPDNETDIDLLGFDFLVDGLVIALSEPRLLPLTVGVLGDWGSGKSSLMGLAYATLSAEAESEAEDRYVCVRFSPWQYEDYEDVKAALMAAVLTRLAAEAAGDISQVEEVGRLRAFVRGFGRRSRRVARGSVGLLPTAVPAITGMIDPSLDPAMLALAQQGVQAATANVADRLAEPAPAPPPDDAVADVEDFRARFADLIEALDHVAAVVVFIDDLDRCLPETVVDTFEAIRLLLGAPHTAFVVAANQKIVEAAVDARYPDLRADDRAHGIGAQYLEKMFQLKITVPALSIPEAVTYVNLLLAELHLGEGDFAKVRQHVASERATHNLEVAFNLGTLGDVAVATPPALVADLQWAAAIAPVLAAGSRGNPRQIKQFLNTLQLRRRSAQRRGVTLDPAVLAKLMLLESQRFDDFQQLFDWQVGSGGPSCPQLAAAERSVLPGDGSDTANATAEPAATAAEGPASSARPRSKARKAVAAPLDDDVREWAAPEPVQAWLRLPPRLATVDLRPYFTYSRDRLSLAAVAAARLSGAQQRLLSLLLASTDTVRRAGLDGLTQTDPSDREPVVDALAQALLTTPEDAFVAVCETIDRIDATHDVLLRALDRLPSTAVPVLHVAVAVRRLPADDPRTVALLDKWAGSGRDGLAKMVGIARQGPARPAR